LGDFGWRTAWLAEGYGHKEVGVTAEDAKVAEVGGERARGLDERLRSVLRSGEVRRPA